MDTGVLSSLLWFIIIGALFYLMMRKGGCVMGMGHSHGGEKGGDSHGEHTATSSKEGKGDVRKDPVCGMDVDIDRARFISFHKDKTLYFCSEDCKGKFEEAPAEFIIEKEEKKGGCC